jgi:IS5 family transposase
MPPLRGRVGRPLKRPRKLLADRGYDHDVYRRRLRARGITPQIARRGTPHGSGLGAQRWVVVRIPGQSDHRFRVNPITRSGAIRSGVPEFSITSFGKAA